MKRWKAWKRCSIRSANSSTFADATAACLVSSVIGSYSTSGHGGRGTRRLLDEYSQRNGGRQRPIGRSLAQEPGAIMVGPPGREEYRLSLIHISEPTRLGM